MVEMMRDGFFEFFDLFLFVSLDWVLLLQKLNQILDTPLAWPLRLIIAAGGCWAKGLRPVLIVRKNNRKCT